MVALLEEKATSIIRWIQTGVMPWFDILMSENDHLCYLLVILVLLVIILILLRKKRPDKRRKGIKGFRNFRGDTWYPDGTVWNQEKKAWEEPDYRNAENASRKGERPNGRNHTDY